VDMAAEKERKEGTTIRGDNRRERKENLRRNERKMRKNARDGVAHGKY
jgi:regulator of ribosome biosynthesis